MRKAVTVAGEVDPDELGLTLMHEHLICNVINPFWKPSENDTDRALSEQPLQLSNLYWASYNVRRNKNNLMLTSEETAVEELAAFAEAGGKTIVEVTPLGIGRDAAALKRIQEGLRLKHIDVHIVCGTSYYVDLTHPEGMDDRSAEDIAAFFVKEINHGIGDSGVRPGIIGEIGCSWPITTNELKVLKGAVQASKQTGVAMSIHPGRDTEAPFQIVQILQEAGAGDLRRVVMGHIDRTLNNLDAMKKLAATGINLEFDLFGMEISYYPFGGVKSMPNDQQRIEWIHELCKSGLRDQIVVSHDVYSKHRLLAFGGHGYRHLPGNLIPRMRDEGMSQEDIQAIFVENPKRILTLASK